MSNVIERFISMLQLGGRALFYAQVRSVDWPGAHAELEREDDWLAVPDPISPRLIHVFLSRALKSAPCLPMNLDRTAIQLHALLRHGTRQGSPAWLNLLDDRRPIALLPRPKN